MTFYHARWHETPIFNPNQQCRASIAPSRPQRSRLPVAKLPLAPSRPQISRLPVATSIARPTASASRLAKLPPQWQLPLAHKLKLPKLGTKIPQRNRSQSQSGGIATGTGITRAHDTRRLGHQENGSYLD